MPGGLIQLITTGIQDSPIIGNPEITFFKTVYKQHTMFSVCQNSRYIGNLNFNKQSSKVIEHNGDLLYSLYFKIEIPYFEITKQITNTKSLLSPYNINELSVTYKNIDSLVIYIIDDWYLIPKILFSLSSFQKYITNIDPKLIQPYVLPDYITTSDYNEYINYYQILDSSVSSLINLLRLNSSYWEQYWLDLISSSTELIFTNQLITLKSSYTSIYLLIKNTIFNLYWYNNYTNLNIDYFNLEFKLASSIKDNTGAYVMKTETERYFEYVNSEVISSDVFDIDIVYKYCQDNFLNFLDYRDNILNNNTKSLLLILLILYSNNTITYTFWKKYNTGDNNNVTTNSIITHNITEWKYNYNIFMSNIFGTNDITNIIQDTFNKSFFNTEQIINNIFNSMILNNPQILYIKLKIITDRFNSIPNFQINFNKGFLGTFYQSTTLLDIDSLYNQDNYDFLLTLGTNNYSSLNTTILSTNETENLSPVDITNIFNIIANEVIDLEFNITDMPSAFKSFIVLWRNVIVNRLYSNYLDVYNKAVNVNDTIRNMAFYHNIIPANMFSTSDFNNSFYEMFFKNSFLGSISISDNDFLKFKENIFEININNLTTDFSKLITNKNFNNLSITNTYSFIYYETIEQTDNYNRINFKQVIYDNINQLLYIKYDNIYNSNTIIVLSINNIIIIPTNIYQKNILNEYNFNSFYLVFTGIISCPINTSIILTVTYTNYIPTLYFYDTNIDYTNVYSNIQLNNYMILAKLPSNSIASNNIINGELLINDSNFINNLNIIVLTINYFNSILTPDVIGIISMPISVNDTIQLVNNINNISLDIGFYLYGVSFYTSSEESVLSMATPVYIPLTTSNVLFTNIPISSNTNVIGRKIYRTRVNDTKFYLLAIITDNIQSTFIDNINDITLGIDYTINNIIKYNILPEITTNVIKLPIKLVLNPATTYYQITTYAGDSYILPTDYSYIYNIYLETFNSSVTNLTINESGTIDINGKYIPQNTLTYPDNYKIFNYLVNSKNLMDIHKLVYSRRTYPFRLNNMFTLTAENNTISNIGAGTYYYSIAMYNTNTLVESFPNNDQLSVENYNIIVTLSNQQVLINSFSPIYDSNYNAYKIYRTKNLDTNDKTLYLIGILLYISNNQYIDTLNDESLTNRDGLDEVGFIITDNIYPNAINRPGTKIIIEYNYILSLSNTHYYYYVITYYSSNIETVPSNIIQMINQELNYIIHIPISSDQRVSGRKIYRTNSLTTQPTNSDFYLLIIIPDNTTLTFIDTTPDADLQNINPPIPVLVDCNEFNISGLNGCPNLNHYISHSTDYNYINTKGISDLNDFLFNKPFIMMSNNSNNVTFTTPFDLMNSFRSPFCYFYNINFKINDTSVIMLNNKVINYIMPLSTQHFFYKEEIDIYYNIYNNALIQVNADQISEVYFNPSFDAINILPDYLINNNYYASSMIDEMIYQIDFILLNNPDYNIITTTIDKINNTFINTSTTFLDSSNNIYGNMSKQVILWIDELNKFYINNGITLPIINYSNTDYFNYTHNVFRYITDSITNQLPAEQLVKFQNNISGSDFLSTITILSPVFTKYGSNNKISSNLYNYLIDVASFYINHIQYINNNIDYLNLTNPNIYIEQYLSNSELTQNIYNIFYNYSGNEISYKFLFPITDLIIYQIIINNNIISNFTLVDSSNNINTTWYDNLNILNNIINTSDYIENKLEDIQYETTQLSINRLAYSDTKFNYIGILNFDESNQIIYDNKYNISTPTKLFMLEDNKIYTINADIIKQQYFIDCDLSDLLVMNPYELILGNSNTIQINYLNTMYLYKVQLIFSTNPPIRSGFHTNFIINNQLYPCDIIIESNNYYLILLSTQLITFKDYKLSLQLIFNDYSSWRQTPSITNYNIILFKQINYISNNININKSDIYQYNNNYYNCYDVITLNNSINFNGTYFYIDNITITDIIIYSNNQYILSPTMIIQNNYIYSYYTFNDYTKKIKTFQNTNYILLVDLVNNIHYMLQYEYINIIPYGNYHTWVLQQNNLNLIEYNVNISIDENGNVINVSNIPNYCYYLITYGNNSCIYYYETGSIMYANGISDYFILKNILLITNISLVDSTLFKSNSKNLLSIYTNITAAEYYVDNTLTDITSTSSNIDYTNNYVYFESIFQNEIFNIVNNSTLNNVGYNEFILQLILIDKRNPSIYIYYPLIVRGYSTEPNIPTIQFINNNITYYSSFIPILLTNTSSIIGNITYNNTIESLSGSIIISTNNPNIYTLSFTSDFLSNITEGQLNLWVLQLTNDSKTIKIYFWTLFTSNQTVINSYLQVGMLSSTYHFSQPFNPMQPLSFIGVNHLLSLPPRNIIETRDGVDFYFVQPTVLTTPIRYKYYNDYRDTNDSNNSLYNVLSLDFNSVHNIKPVVELLVNNSSNYNFTDNNNNIYYIITYLLNDNQIIIPILKSEFTLTYNSIINTVGVSFLSIYFSINYPMFINNNIILINISGNIYKISSYDKLYLEMNEIISLDGNYFIINGLNVFTNNYELTLLTGTNNIRYMYSGYYTLGNYLSKNNNIIPSIEYQNTMIFYKNYKLFVGELYFTDSFNICTTSINLDCFVFNDKPQLINLFQNEGKYYLFDNFIKLKVLDNIVLNEIIYEIRAIVDNQIYFSNELNINIDIQFNTIYNSLNSNSNNTFILVSLSYQPFDIILFNNIKNNQTVIFTLLSSNNNYINITDNTIYNNGLVKLFKTNYCSNFENIMNIPDTLQLNNIIFNNQHPIVFNTLYNTTYNGYQIINNTLLADPLLYNNSYNFFYFQPVKINGTFDYIKNIISDIGGNYYIILFNNSIIPNLNINIQMSVSSSYITQYNYYLYQQFSYNFAIQIHNYYLFSNYNNQQYEVTRYVFSNNILISIQNYSNNNKIIFIYGKSISENETINNIIDGYTSIYFFRSFKVNNDGTFNNFDTLLGSYHLITYFETNQHYTYLAKIVYPNTFYFYTLPTAMIQNNYFQYNCLIDKLPNIRIDNTGEYTYSNLVITQSKNLMDVNQDIVKIVKQYQIKFYGTPTIIDNKYYQQIIFINSSVDTGIYSQIYIDIKSYLLVYKNSNYYIVSDNYLSNSFTNIYTIDINYLVYAQNNKSINTTLKISDTNILNNYITSQINNTDVLIQNIQLSNINNTNTYSYKLLDNTNNINLNNNETYNINSFNYNITQINNTIYTIQTSQPIDNDTLQISDIYININLLVIIKSTSKIINTSILFPNIKQLKILLLNNSTTDKISIYNYLKPWDSWSILNSIIKVNTLSNLVNLGYIDIYGNFNQGTYSYLTNNEVSKLSSFIVSINSSDIKKQNFYITQEIEVSINNNLNNWLNNPNFFMNAQQNINDFLIACGYNVTFNGTNIIFDNDLNPDVNEVNEIAGYITDEYTYDDINFIVYRSNDSYNNINDEILNWVNKTLIISYFGINIHQLLRYLVVLGTSLVDLINTFSNTLIDTSYYVLNNPLKFIINKIWEKNFNTDKTVRNLDSTFKSNLQYNITFENPNNNLESLVEYLPDLSIFGTGLNSINYYNVYTPRGEMNIININLNEPFLNFPTTETINLVINPIFPYTITFNNNIINSGCTYSINYLNGVKIAQNIVIPNTILYPGQINFYSDYDIKSSDFIVVDQTTSYQIIKSTLLGYLYTLTFDNINYQYIDNIYYNNVQLTILSNTDNINIMVPFESDELQLTDLLEIYNLIAIKNISTINNNQYLEFYSNKFNYISNNTLLKTNLNLYNLNYDGISYYITGLVIDSMDVTIITLIIPQTIINLNQVSYEYQLGTNIDSSIYNPSYFQFNIVNTVDQTTITPIKVSIINTNNIIYYYNINDYKTISYYLYYINYIIPSTLTTVIYLYDIIIDDITSYIPLVDSINKVSSYFTQSGTQTFFNNPNSYTSFQLNNKITFIQQNSWDIETFTISNLTLTFRTPSDFIFNTTSKYYYKINSIIITQISQSSNIVTIILTSSFTDTTLNFQQYYIETIFTVLFNTTQSNYNLINYNKRLGENIINQITNIQINNEFLYYFTFIIPSTTTTIIFLYDKTIDDIYSTYEPLINPQQKISIYFNINNNQTNFTTSLLYTKQEISSNILFVQKNLWEIINYIVTDTTISFNVPSDFILNTSNKYYYKINDIVIDKTTFIFQSGNIIINLSEPFIDTILIFKQYYIETENILISPILNTSVKIDYFNLNQYTIYDNFYMIPYTSNKTEFDDYLYIINSGISTDLIGFIGGYNESNYTILLFNQITKYNGKIFDQYNDTFIYYVISLSQEIDTTLIYTFSFIDSIIYPIISIQFYQNSLQYGHFYKQDSSNYIYLFMNNSINNYTQPDNISNNFYLISYDTYTLVNLYNPNIFIQNTQMTRTTQSNITINTITEPPIFNDYSKLFNSYSLYFNDQLVEEINEDVINLNTYLYCNENDTDQIKKMTQIRFNGTSWELYMPLIFWFCNKPGLSIPSVALPHTNIILKYQLNPISTVLSNDLSGSYSLNIVPEVKITLLTEFILLDMIERTLFGTYSHEYIINRYKIYPNLFVNTQSFEAHRFFTGLVKDIYLISKPLNSNLTYYPQEIPKYDYKYGKYITSLSYYNLFIINNVYTSIDQINYATDIEIITNNVAELNIYNTTGIGDRIKLLLANFDEMYLDYFMYYEDKYLSLLIPLQQINVLTIYLKFQYSDKIYINEISPLLTLSIRVNGAEIFAARDNMYYNNVIPFNKFKNSLPTGYYTYSFSLYPLDDQPSGHLNFTYFDDVSFIITSDPTVNTTPYLLDTIIKEYNILRVMSGIGSLAWIS